MMQQSRRCIDKSSQAPSAGQGNRRIDPWAKWAIAEALGAAAIAARGPHLADPNRTKISMDAEESRFGIVQSDRGWKTRETRFLQ
jgi:hypothetical protein